MSTANDEVLLDWKRHLQAAGRAPGTVSLRVLHLRQFTAQSPVLLEASTRDMEAYLAAKRLTHKPESRKAIRSSLMGFYAWAAKAGHLTVNPAEDLPPIYVPQRAGRIAPDLDVIRALELASLPEKALILLGRYGGLRIGEITTLHTDQRHGDLLRIIGKGQRERIVPLNDELAATLDRLEAQQGPGYYFPGRYGGHAHKESLSKIIKSRLGWNPHSLRHAAATAAYRGSGDLRAVQQLLGHASLATTQRYLHVDEDQIRRAAAATMLGGTRSSEIVERAGMASLRGGRG